METDNASNIDDNGVCRFYSKAWPYNRDLDYSDEDNVNQREKRSARNSKKQLGAAPKPDVLSYYEGIVKGALEAAKKRFQGYVMMHNGFPSRDLHLHEAGYALTAIIEDFKSKNYYFEPRRISAYN